jgi:hypothetical protein
MARFPSPWHGEGNGRRGPGTVALGEGRRKGEGYGWASLGRRLTGAGRFQGKGAWATRRMRAAI